MEWVVDMQEHPLYLLLSVDPTPKPNNNNKYSGVIIIVGGQRISQALTMNDIVCDLLIA